MPKGLMVHTTGSSVAGAGKVHKFLNDGSAVFGSGSATAGVDNKSITMFDATNGAGSVTVYGNLSASVNLSASGFYGDGSNLSGVTANSIKADDIAAGDAAVTITTSDGNITLQNAAGDTDAVMNLVNPSSTEATALNINTPAGGLTQNHGGAMSITGGDDSTIQVGTAAKDLTLQVAGGGAQQLILNSAGTGTNAIDINATAGGIDVDANGAFAVDAGGISLDSTGGYAANLSVATGGGDAVDLTIASTGGGDSSVLISSAGTGADALSLDVSAGSMVVAPSLADGQTLKLGKNGAVEMVFTPHGTAGNEKWSLTNTAGTAADAIAIDASAGGISIDAAAASNFSTSAGALTLDGNGGVNIAGNAAEIDITTSAALDLNSGAGTWNASTLGLTSTGTMTVTSVAYDHNASGAVTIDTSDTTNGVKIGASTSGMPITLGHTTSEVTVADNLTVAGDLTVQGTTTTVNVEVVQSANGVIFEGASADDYETTLKAEDPTADHTYHLPDLGSTNDEGYVMAFEANPGTSPLITATPAEVNLLDGGTSAGTTAVAGSDGIVTNDGGTMRQTTVDTFDTYLAATTKTLTNKTIDADNNTLSNIEVDNFKADAIVTESEGIGSNDNDTTIPTSAAVKNYVDTSASNISPTNEASDVETFLIFTNAATGAQAPKTNTKLTLNTASDHLMMSGTLFAHTASVTDLNAAVISGSSNSNMEISSDQDLVFVIDANNTGTQNYTFKSTTSSIAEMDDAGSLQLSGGLSASLGVSGSELWLSSVLVTSTAAELNLLDGTTNAAYDQTADSVVFYDASDGKLKYEAANDFADAINGTGLEASAGTLRLAAQGTGIAGGAGSTLSVAAAQTSITSVYNSSLVVGYGASHANIDFGTDNQINFDIDGTAQIQLTDGALLPVTDDDVDLGSSTKEFKNAYFDGTVEADAYTVAGVALDEHIADTAGAMFSSNTETGISATYQDADNTIDLEIAAAQTTITSLLNDNLVVGRATGNDDITFSDDTIDLMTDNTSRLKVETAQCTVSNNLIVTGNLTVNGATTTVSTTNMVVEDKLVELANGQSGTPSGDIGMVFERGDSDNAFMGWDESADEFHLATTSATGGSTGDLTLASAHLRTKSNRLAGYDKDTAADLTELNAIATTPSNYNGMVFYVSDAPTSGAAFNAGVHTSGKFYFVEGGVIYPSPFTNS